MTDEWRLRRVVYDELAAHGEAPSFATLTEVMGDEVSTRRLLREMHDRHLVVLDEHDEIRMALPFSARPSAHRVVAADGRAWWANCAWDSMAISAALDVNVTIEASWLDTGEPVELSIVDGELRGDTSGFVHYAIAARHWWDDIVET